MVEPIFTRSTILRNLINLNATAKISSNVTHHMKLNVRYCRTIDNEIKNKLDLDETPTNKISNLMKKYTERIKKHEEYLQKEIAEFEIGKRHLANIMGEDPENFTQHNINMAIKYLFPSGLYEKRCRPMLLHPSKIIPPTKTIEFDDIGRPLHFLFYTSKPKYYEILHNISKWYLKLNNLEDEMDLTKSKETLDLIESIWITKDDIEPKLDCKLSDDEFNYLVSSLERLLQHPMASHAKEFIMQYRKQICTTALLGKLLPVRKDKQNGKPYVVVTGCLRKSARGTVIVRGEGCGQITINGESISYFQDKLAREQIIFPLIFTNMADKVDIEAFVTGGGSTGQAGAIRWGIAYGLRSFVTPEVVNQMRIAGLLTKDWRKRERKKFGQEGARRKFTWKKR